MKTLLEILQDRSGQLDDAEGELRVQLQAIDQERQALARAIEAAAPDAMVFQKVREFSVTEIVDSRPLRAPKRASERTIKTAVIDLLKKEGHGMTALDILEGINAALNVDYPRTSLSPQLSRLKAEGWLERDAVVWSLAEIATELDYPNSSGSAAEIKEKSPPTPEIGGPPELN